MYLVLLKQHGYYVNQQKSLKVFKKFWEMFLSTIILWLTKKELVMFFIKIKDNKTKY